MMTDEALLDRISLDDFSVEFKRTRGKSVNYYHWHQCLELLFIESGVGIVVVDNQKFTARPGRMFIFPQGKIHKVMVENTSSNCYQRTIIHVDVAIMSGYLRTFTQRYKLFSEISAADAHVSIYDLSQSQEKIENIFDLFWCGYLSSSGKSELMALLLLNILDFLSAGVHVRAGKSGLLSSKIMQQIEEGYLYKLSLQDMAKKLGVSASYASRTFRKETGGTIQEYILIRRIKHASELLEYTSLSVAEVAAQSGFNYTTYFIKCFNEIVGCAPLKYKQRLLPKV
ncbi:MULTISPECIES: AraC family transcriptional regulator [unclassified Brenneria]|uniref:AraC family transcriptional regulator n=1 Tax=unclassified Brenneria TaxID=2634434 RepID=UPI0029C2E84C|nr:MULTISPECIES: AraC family transcriptional regulator [unclassified Brenneria]MDX5628421.1 AraC family transcriptional regulator [Brenneria sp. L3-3Z]MDX5695396.1 AraC family transcriptional regulator [Brenneria sp. L4-2C]